MATTAIGCRRREKLKSGMARGERGEISTGVVATEKKDRQGFLWACGVILLLKRDSFFWFLAWSRCAGDEHRGRFGRVSVSQSEGAVKCLSKLPDVLPGLRSRVPPLFWRIVKLTVGPSPGSTVILRPAGIFMARG